jgi:hypothetical protein
MGPDLDRRATEAASSQAHNAPSWALLHTGLTAFPAVEGKRIPTILQVGFMPAADGIVVQVEKLCDPSTAFPVVEQQDRICPAGIPWSSRWRRTQASSSIRSAEERKPGRIMGIAGSFQAQPSSHQIRLPQDSEYIKMEFTADLGHLQSKRRHLGFSAGLAVVASSQPTSPRGFNSPVQLYPRYEA